MKLINKIRANARLDAADTARTRAARAGTPAERKAHERYAKICEGQARVLRGK